MLTFTLHATGLKFVIHPAEIAHVEESFAVVTNQYAGDHRIDKSAVITTRGRERFVVDDQSRSVIRQVADARRPDGMTGGGQKAMGLGA